MKLEQQFSVKAPIDEVWAALIDVERIAPCLPGAEITGQDDDGAWMGSFTVKLGPTTAAYNGKLHMQELDEANHVATLSAKGTDKRGQGGATATIVNSLSEKDGMTVVDVDTDFAITGRLARFGRSGMIEDISKRMIRDFAQCLEAMIGAEQDAKVAAAPAAQEATAAAAGGPAPATQPTRPAPPQPAKPVGAFSLVMSVLRDRLKRLIGNRPRAPR